MHSQEYAEKLTVLVIEDNLGDFVLVEDYLEEKFKKVEIVHFTDFSHSIEYLNKNKEEVDVILLDLNLPDLQGIELINSILDYNFGIPIIILTGYSDLGMAQKSLQIGVYDYLVKDDLNPAILYKTIVFAINRSGFINLIESEKLNYENLFNFSPQPTWLLDAASLKILNANNAAQNKYEFSLEDFQKMLFTQLHPKEEGELIQQKLISNEVKFTRNHFTHYLSNGKEIKVDIYFKELISSSNKLIIVQSNDISETLKHISTIEIQNEKLRNIAWTQSHVVRAPLARILGIINLIETKTDDIDEILSWLKQLRISTNEMDEIVNKIVSEARYLDKD